MTIQRMDHVGIVVDDLAAGTEFFVELGLERQGGGRIGVIAGPSGAAGQIIRVATAPVTPRDSPRPSRPPRVMRAAGR